MHSSNQTTGVKLWSKVVSHVDKYQLTSNDPEKGSFYVTYNGEY